LDNGDETSMVGARYCVHDLLEIHVSPRVKKNIVKMLDFQLGSLKAACSHHPIDYQLAIKPYDEFAFEPGASVINLWQASGVTDCSYNNPKEQLGITKDGNSLVIYANKRNFPINMFIQLLLLGQGFSLLPAAALVDQNNNATLLTGAGGTGKTTITLSAVKNGNYRLLGDDTVCIASAGYGLSYPREFTIKDYHSNTFPEYFSTTAKSRRHGSKSFKKTFVKQLIGNMPFLGLLNMLLQKLDQPELLKKIIPDFSQRQPNGLVRTVPLEAIYGLDKIVPRADIDQIIYLERYHGSSFATGSMEPEMLASRLCALLHNEWALSMRRLCLMSVLGLFDFDEFVSQSREIIYEAVKGRHCEYLRIPDSCTPEALSRYYLSHYAA
jgi:hypothetical protein